MTEGHCQTGIVYNYFVLGAVADYFSGCGTGRQYFSDGDVHSGTDAYLRAKDYLCISWNDDIWFLDTNQSDRVYQYALVRL